MSHPLVTGACLFAMGLGVIWGACTVATTIWFERVFLPRIAGED